MVNVVKHKQIEKSGEILIKCHLLEGINIINKKHNDKQCQHLGIQSTKTFSTSGGG